MPEQTTQETLAPNGPNRPIVGIVEQLGHARRGGRDGAVAQPLVWPMGIVKARVFLCDVIEMIEPEAEKVIEGFTFEAPDP